MNKALLQPSGSKWRVMAAFTAAATIHLSALAIASLHHDASVLSPGTKFTAIDIDPGVAPPEPAQIEVPLPPPPRAVEFPEFIESSNPPRVVQKRQAFIPIRSQGQTPPAGWRNSRGLALSAPRPEYPYEARSHHIVGSGVANLTVHPTSGVVVGVKMEQSIGSPILDNATLSAFRRWRFKPGTPSTVRIPITFNLAGASY